MVLVNAVRRALFIFCILGVIGYLFFTVSHFVQLPKPSGKMWVYVFFGWLAIPISAAIVTYWTQQHDAVKLTVELEKHYPRLRDRLLTVIELSEGKPVQSSFTQSLVKQLEREMGSLLNRFHFARSISPQKLILPITLTLLFVGSIAVHAMVQPSFFRGKNAPSLNFPELAFKFGENLAGFKEQQDFEMMINPGNCQVTPGSSLIVEAKIQDYGPKQVQLFTRRSHDTAWQVLPMILKGEQVYRYEISNVREKFSYYVQADYQRTPIYEVQLLEVLRMENVLWTMNFPEYMKLAPQKRQGWHDKITVPEGTVIQLEIQTNQPASGSLQISGEKVPLIETGPRVFTMNFPAEKDAQLELQLVSEEGEPLLGIVPAVLQVLPDLPPYLEVLAPQEQNYVFATEEIPFRLNLNDDYGIESVTFVLHEKERDERIEWLESQDDTVNFSLSPVLSLEGMGLESRDLITGYIEVKDNYPGEEPHILKSPLFTFFVRDFVEQFKLNAKTPPIPSLRTLFGDVLSDQERVIQQTWDLISMPSAESFAAVENPHGN